MRLCGPGFSDEDIVELLRYLFAVRGCHGSVPFALEDGTTHCMVLARMIALNGNDIVVNEERGIEGPCVHYWKDHYWMITDPHNGIQVYRSASAKDWEKMGTILADPGDRALDITRGRHASVSWLAREPSFSATWSPIARIRAK